VDARQRQLERAGAAGDAGARVRALVERVRRADLGRAGLALAAYAGDPAARGALAALATPAPPTPADPRDLAIGLKEHGPEAVVRAGVAVAELLLPAWPAAWGAAPAEAVAVAVRWIREPAARRALRGEARRRAERASRAALRVLRGPADAAPAFAAHCAAHAAEEATHARFAAALAADWVGRAVRIALGRSAYGLRPDDARDRWAPSATPAEVAGAIRAGLVPWALSGAGPGGLR